MVLIEKKNPLKQGLKLGSLQRRTGQFRIEKKNPLKQGLKRCHEAGITDYA